MKHLKKSLLLVLLPLFAFTTMHKFYVSVTQVSYSEKDKSLQIINRIFIDDFEYTLEKRYGISPKLETEKERANIDLYIERYLAQHFSIKVNNKVTPFKYIGKAYENDVIKCYLEIGNIEIDTVKSIEVNNSLLFDQFEEQNNIVHFKIKDLRKSFSLVQGNDKGLLKL